MEQFTRLADKTFMVSGNRQWGKSRAHKIMEQTLIEKGAAVIENRTLPQGIRERIYKLDNIQYAFYSRA